MRGRRDGRCVPAPDLVFHNGPILTMEGGDRVVDALAVTAGHITAVGDAAKAAMWDAKRLIDLEGRTLLPGFIDAHNHLVDLGMRLMRLDLGGLQDKGQLIQMVDQRAQMTPAEGWVIGHSWDETVWDEATLPSQDELEAAAGGRKMVLARVDRHASLATRAALEAVGLDPDIGPFVVEEDHYKVVRAVEPAPQTLVKAIGTATRHCHERGVTSSHVICHGNDLRALQAAREAGVLGVRVSCYLGEEHLDSALALGLRQGLGDAWIRVQGIKLYADGSFGSHTAAVDAAYADRPDGKGMLLHPDGEFEDKVKRAHRAGLQLAIHTIGERAARRVIAALEVAGVTPRDRVRLEHLESVDDGDLASAARMGLIASCQPNFTVNWGQPGQMYERRLGPERAARLNRFADYRAAGLSLAFGSDDMPLGPLAGLAGATEAPHAAQRIAALDALRAMTSDAARAAFAEGEVGKLAAGYHADLVVLDNDPRQVPAADLRVCMTVAAGQVVYEKW